MHQFIGRQSLNNGSAERSVERSRGGSTGGSAELTVEASPSARLRSPNVRSLAERPKSRSNADLTAEAHTLPLGKTFSADPNYRFKYTAEVVDRTEKSF